MKKEELQKALIVSGIYTVSSQLSSLLDELGTLPFPEEMRDDIESFGELSDLINEKCRKYLDRLKVE